MKITALIIGSAISVCIENCNVLIFLESMQHDSISNNLHALRAQQNMKMRALIILSAIWRLGLKPQAITCRPYGTSPSGTTGNSPAIYCRVVETMFIFI
jgi:hypothetical protein